MKTALLALFAAVVFVGSITPAQAQHRHKHCWVDHGHRHCAWK
ncbi:hypothetical protein [Granulicella paludicola]|jgi:hypothetical protein|nr:hypothetical protein [Granulicella paludicola]